MSKDKVQDIDNRAVKGDYDWQQPFPDAIDKEKGGVLHQMFPTVDYALYNRGLWGPLEVSRAKHIFPLLYDWAGKGKAGRCFYKGTTGTSGKGDLYEKERTNIRREALQAGCSFLDLGHVTADFQNVPYLYPEPPLQEGGKLSEQLERSEIFWDSVHYFPWVYEELNNVLMNVLCNWK